MEFLMIILMATLLLAVVFGLGVTWGAWSEFQAVSTHSRPKAAGHVAFQTSLGGTFQLTAARRRLA